MSQPGWQPPQRPHQQPGYPPQQPYPGHVQPGQYNAGQAYQAYQPPPIPYAPTVQPTVQPAYSGAVTKTRPPFPHGKHIRWTIFSLGIWGVIGYPWAYCWHRFGPTKAVSTTRFV